MATARDELLDRAIGYSSVHGLSDASLRELATGIGTSHRMLIYHFGSRDGLVAAIVERIESDQRETLRRLAASAASPAEVIRSQWATLTDPALRPFVALFFEVLALAVRERPGTQGFLDRLTDPWLETATEAAQRLGLDTSIDELRLGIAVMRGLLIEVLASGEVAGPTASLHRYLELWELGAPQP